MRVSLVFIILFLFQASLNSQDFSKTLKEEAETIIENVDGEHQQFYFDLLQKRDSIMVNKRMDTLSYDFAYIQESYCTLDGKCEITERYFSSDSVPNFSTYAVEDQKILPRHFFVNGVSQGVTQYYFSKSVAGTYYYDIIDYFFTADTLRENLKSLSLQQELFYDQSIKVKRGGYGALFEIPLNGTKEPRQSQIEEKLKHTYQIISVIDREKNETKVSIQSPVKEPKIKLSEVEIMHMDW